MEDIIRQTRDNVEAFLREDIELQNMQIDLILVNPQTNETITLASDGQEKMIQFAPYTTKENGYENGYMNVPEWDFNFDTYLFKELQKGYEVGYMSDECHYGVWQTIDEWYPEEFDNIDGVQKYLKYCKDNGITKEYLDNKIGLNTKDVMQYYENLEIGDTMEYLEYIAEVDEINPENNKEHIVNFYENKQDYIDGKKIESISLKAENLKQNIRDYIEGNYNLEEKDMGDERAYFTFVLGYDVLQDMFRNSTAPECDLVYDFCDYEAGRFLESKEYRNPKHSGYEMLVEWVDKNKGQILEDFKEITGGEIEIYNGNMRIIEKGYRNKEPIALVEKTVGNEKEYIVAFFYTTQQDKLEWAYGYYYDNDKVKAQKDFQKVVSGDNLADTFNKKESRNDYEK